MHDSELIKFISSNPTNDKAFETLALKLFHYQYENNPVYRKFCDERNASPLFVKRWKEIPALPVLYFKNRKVSSFMGKPKKIFMTSGTTRAIRGKHFLDTLDLYKEAAIRGFQNAVGIRKGEFAFYFILRSPKDAPESSLSCMAGWIQDVFGKKGAQFYVQKNKERFVELTKDLQNQKGKVFIFSTALSLKNYLDYLKDSHIQLKLKPGSHLLETGGFKGRIKAVSRKDLYGQVSRYLGIKPRHIISEYGMTELSSQFYDTGKNSYVGPAWVRFVIIDPVTGKEARKGDPGVLRIYDLANRPSIMAIETEDIARAKAKGFELLGRASEADLRGCSLSYEDIGKR